MPFTPRQKANYNTDLRLLVRDNEAFADQVYQPNDHVPTIGYGYTFVRLGIGGWARYERLDPDLAAIGHSLTQPQRQLLDDIVVALNQGNTTQADTLIAQFRASFGAITSGDADTLFQLDVNQRSTYIRTRFRNVLGQTDGDALFNRLSGTHEMMAVFDFAYYRGPGRLGRDFIFAMHRGDRAQAWFELRYHSLPSNPQPGHVLRNYRDGDLFSLYEVPGQASADEARQVYQMLTLQRGAITDYQRLYPPPMNVQSLDAALIPARDAIIGWVNTQLPPGAAPITAAMIDTASAIYLDPGRDNAAQAVDPNHSGVLIAARYDSTGNEIRVCETITDTSEFGRAILGA